MHAPRMADCAFRIGRNLRCTCRNAIVIIGNNVVFVRVNGIIVHNFADFFPCFTLVHAAVDREGKLAICCIGRKRTLKGTPQRCSVQRLDNSGRQALISPSVVICGNADVVIFQRRFCRNDQILVNRYGRSRAGRGFRERDAFAVYQRMLIVFRINHDLVDRLAVFLLCYCNRDGVSGSGTRTAEFDFNAISRDYREGIIVRSIGCSLFCNRNFRFPELCIRICFRRYAEI